MTLKMYLNRAIKFSFHKLNDNDEIQLSYKGPRVTERVKAQMDYFLKGNRN